MSESENMNITSPDGYILTAFPVEKLWSLKGTRGEPERCGIMLGIYSGVGDRHIFRVSDLIEVTNTSDSETTHFEMKRRDIMEANSQAMGIIGFIHTHFDMGADPSMEDIEGITIPNVAHFVFHPPSAMLTMYNSDGYITKFKIKEPKK